MEWSILVDSVGNWRGKSSLMGASNDLATVTITCMPTPEGHQTQIERRVVKAPGKWTLRQHTEVKPLISK
jgi:hypothetical protein